MCPDTAAPPAAESSALTELEAAIIRPADASANIAAALELLGYVRAALVTQVSPKLAVQYGEYLTTIEARLSAAGSQLQAERVAIRTFAALVNGGGLEFVPAGTTDAHRELFRRTVKHLASLEDGLSGEELSASLQAELDLVNAITAALDKPGPSAMPSE